MKISPELWFAINTLIMAAMRKVTGELEGLTEEEILAKAKEEEERSNRLAERDRNG